MLNTSLTRSTSRVSGGVGGEQRGTRPNRHPIAQCLIAALTAVVGLSHAALAGDITYTIQSPANPTVGGSIEGTITTDGNTGTLATGDFLSWDISVLAMNGSTLLTLNQSNSSVGNLAGITATSQDLILTAATAGADTQLVFDESGAQFVGWVDISGGAPYVGSGSSGTMADYFVAAITVPYTIAVAAAVPEPGSLVLASIGALAATAYGWRRQAANRRRERQRQTA